MKISFSDVLFSALFDIFLVLGILSIPLFYVNCAKTKYQPGPTEEHKAMTSSCEKGTLCLSSSQKDCFNPEEYKELEPGTVCRKQE